MLHTLKTHEHLKNTSRKKKKKKKKEKKTFMTPFFLCQTRGALRIS